jgi:hypothetical protein
MALGQVKLGWIKKVNKTLQDYLSLRSSVFSQSVYLCYRIKLLSIKDEGGMQLRKFLSVVDKGEEHFYRRIAFSHVESHSRINI